MLTNRSAEDLADVLDQPLIAVLATRRPDDTILLSPVWYEWRDGAFLVWVTGEKDRKPRHLRRDPRASIVVATTEWPYKGFEVTGEAAVLDEPQLWLDLVGRTARRYFGEERGAAMAESTTTPGLVIRLAPGKTRGWDYTDEA